ncbi:MAG: MipA/OmpV family protein [Gammaproteobacteria bacterium]
MLAVLLGMAVSAASPAAEDEEPLPLWEIGAGVAAGWTPDYPAAEESSFRALPFPAVVYRGDFLRIGDSSVVTGRLFRSDRLEFDVSLDGSLDADSDDIEARSGMPDLGFLFEAGPELEIRLNDPADEAHTLKLELPLRGVFSWDDEGLRSRGVVFNPELEYEKEEWLGSPWELSLSVAPVFATRELHDYFYTVEPVYATPDRPAYRAGSGYLQTEFGFRVTRRDPKRFLFFGLTVNSHTGSSNEASPLYRNDFTWAVYAGVIYAIWQSEEPATD